MGGDAAVPRTYFEETTMLKERELTEISWEKPGTKVTGHLLRIQKVRYSDNVGIKYLVRSDAGKLITFKGAAKLDVFLTTADIGRLIEVTFIGNDVSREPKPGMSPAKLFRVAVDEESEKIAADFDEATITDADIPF